MPLTPPPPPSWGGVVGSTTGLGVGAGVGVGSPSAGGDVTPWTVSGPSLLNVGFAPPFEEHETTRNARTVAAMAARTAKRACMRTSSNRRWTGRSLGPTPRLVNSLPAHPVVRASIRAGRPHGPSRRGRVRECPEWSHPCEDGCTPRTAFGERPGADEMDRHRHAERVDGRRQRRHAAPLRSLPDGTFVAAGDVPALVLGDRLVPWSP